MSSPALYLAGHESSDLLLLEFWLAVILLLRSWLLKLVYAVQTAPAMDTHSMRSDGGTTPKVTQCTIE